MSSCLGCRNRLDQTLQRNSLAKQIAEMFIEKFLKWLFVNVNNQKRRQRSPAASLLASLLLAKVVGAECNEAP